MIEYGVSFSIKQCRNFGLDDSDCLRWLIKFMGFKRFRLMSYWDEIESSPGKCNFSYLDKHIDMISNHKGKISLCLGVRQPRWPENHWPEWAMSLNKSNRDEALANFIKLTVNRYKSNPSIVSYQLENEALLKSFGLNPEVDRSRLQREFALIKAIDPLKPIVMTTSTSWGVPIRRPIPDIVGFSFYQTTFNDKKQRYDYSVNRPWIHAVRAKIIKLLWNKPSFIHELQLEPWGPKNIWEMSETEQNKSMSPDDITRNLTRARETGLKKIDLWGGEWWYWMDINNSKEVAQLIKREIA